MLPNTVRNEIIQLHEFFEAWFIGRINNSDENFSRLSDVIAEDFQIISPNANISDKATLLKNVRQGHGSRAGQPYSVSVDNIRGRQLNHHLYLVIYEEWQEVGHDNTGRLSTAILRNKAEAPNGLEWLYVHETWLVDTA